MLPRAISSVPSEIAFSRAILPCAYRLLRFQNPLTYSQNRGFLRPMSPDFERFSAHLTVPSRLVCPEKIALLYSPVSTTRNFTAYMNLFFRLLGGF